MFSILLIPSSLVKTLAALILGLLTLTLDDYPQEEALFMSNNTDYAVSDPVQIDNIDTAAVKAMQDQLVVMPCAAAPDLICLDSFEQLVWQYRVILLKPDLLNASDLLDLQTNEMLAAMQARDIIWFMLQQELLLTNAEVAVSRQFVRELTAKIADEAEALLIGKDGEIKLRQQQFELSAMLELIDTMPMRRREMQ